MPFDPRSLFDDHYTKFFDGPPLEGEIGPGELGVNIDLFDQINIHYRKAQNNMPERVLADMCQDIKRNGYIGKLEDSALRLSVALTTVQRWRNRFQETGLIIQESRHNRYSIDPKVAIKKDNKGNLVEPGSNKNDVFTF